jgi:ABC-2 type transport system permease protein
MNTQSNTLPNSPVALQGIVTPHMSIPKQFYWSGCREFWENRSLYLAPLGVAAVFLAGFSISLVRLPEKMRAALLLGPMQQHQLIELPYDFAALLIMGATFIVAILYCLDALYAERRDRSILFWKSLPVSDLTTVLAKACIPIVVLPLLTFAVTVVTQCIMLLLNTAVLLGSRQSVAALWTHLSLWHMSWMLLYHLVALHGLWYAPIFGWLLLVSAWARRVPFLWAALPLLAIGFVEKVAFNTSYLAGQLAFRVIGGPETAVSPAGSMSMDAMSRPTPGQLLSSPGLWVGLVFTAIFLATAVRLRRNREPI